MSERTHRNAQTLLPAASEPGTDAPMIVIRSFRAALPLLAATAVSLSLAGHPAVAAQDDTATHHHHHHGEGKKDAAAEKGTKKHSKDTAAAHHKAVKTAKEPTEAKPHTGKKHKAHSHPDEAHHEAHPHKAAATRPHASRRPVPVAAPLPETEGPDAAATDDQNAAPAAAQPQDKGSNTGLPLPRFASLRADKVNMRAGPGERYPILWVYHRRGMPVQIEREFDVWRLVEDSDGVKGWVHQATLAGARDFVIPTPPGATPPVVATQDAPAEKPASDKAAPAGTDKPDEAARHTESRVIGHVATLDDAGHIPGAVVLRASADSGSAPVAVLEPGTIGTIRTCAAGSGWCRVSVKSYDGWIQRKQFWGLLGPDEVYPQPS